MNRRIPTSVALACLLLAAGVAGAAEYRFARIIGKPPQVGEPINLAVGVVLTGKVGSVVRGGSSLATVYADSEGEYDAALPLLNEAFTFSDSPVPMEQIIKASVA